MLPAGEMKVSAEHWWNVTSWGNPKRGKAEVLGGKTCRNSTLVTTQLTWTSPVLNTGLRCERPVTDSLSPGSASQDYCLSN